MLQDRMTDDQMRQAIVAIGRDPDQEPDYVRGWVMFGNNQWIRCDQDGNHVRDAADSRGAMTWHIFCD